MGEEGGKQGPWEGPLLATARCVKKATERRGEEGERGQPRRWVADVAGYKAEGGRKNFIVFLGKQKKAEQVL